MSKAAYKVLGRSKSLRNVPGFSKLHPHNFLLIVEILSLCTTHLQVNQVVKVLTYLE